MPRTLEHMGTSGYVEASADDPLPTVGGGAALTLLEETTITAAATNEVLGTLVGLGGYNRALLALAVTDKKDEAADTCDLFIDTSPDGGTTWFNVGQFTRLLGNGTDADTEIMVLNSAATPGTATINVTSDAGAPTVRPAMFGDRLRVRHTTAKNGPTASFTFSIAGYFKG